MRERLDASAVTLQCAAINQPDSSRFDFSVILRGGRYQNPFGHFQIAAAIAEIVPLVS
jgi:hypothetical protein